MDSHLKRTLHSGIEIEIEITLQVAALLAVDHRAFEIRDLLGISTQEYDVAVARLQRAARLMGIAPPENPRIQG
jgi:hypothetical protein